MCLECESENHEVKDRDSEKSIFIIDRANRQTNKEELKYRLEEYGKMKCIKTREGEYRRLENVGMVCFEAKDETSTAIQDLNETTRYIAKEYEPNICKQEKIHTNMTQGNEKE